MAGKRSSPSHAAHSKRYESENRAVKNREARLERHCKKFPNDAQAESALSRGLKYRRNNVGKWKVWTAQKRKFAILWKMFGQNPNEVLEKGFLDNHSFKQMKD